MPGTWINSKTWEPYTSVQCLSVDVVAVRPSDSNKTTQHKQLVVPTGLRWWTCCRSTIGEKKLVVPTGLRWWPCCFRRLRDRNVRSVLRKDVGSSPRISACNGTRWPLSFSIILWLIMSGLHPHPGPSVGALVRVSSSYTGPVIGAVFKKGAGGMGYYTDEFN